MRLLQNAKSTYAQLHAHTGSRSFRLMVEQLFWEWSQGVLEDSQNFCDNAILGEKKEKIKLLLLYE